MCTDSELKDKMWKNMDGLWQCNDCGYTSPKTSNVRNHIEVNHTASQGYYCQDATNSADPRTLSIFINPDTNTRLESLLFVDESM